MKQARLNISDAKGRLSFTTRVDNTRPWWRDLDLDGKPLYRIGNICNTCEAFFSKSDDAQLPLAPSVLAEHLRSGLEDIPENILDTIAPILPKGDYVVGLLSLQPAWIRSKVPGYDVWRNNQPARVPNERWPKAIRMKPWWFEEPDPSASPGEDILYEAVLPIIQEAQLNQATIDTYTSLMQNGLRPTALALSVVDVRVLSGRGLDWRLMHFLLDGHHKIMAADRSGKPITLLSFLNISESFAGREWVDLAIQARYQG